MSETPCGSCGDRRRPVALRAGRVVVCSDCTAAILPWFLQAPDAEVEALFGFAVPHRQSGLTTLGDAAVHRDLALAYRELGLSGDACEQWALAAIAGDADDALPRLLEPVIGRATLAALARSVGSYLAARRSTAS